MKKINVVAPVYNEEEGIIDFHEALQHVIRNLTQYEFEIIYVLDKSRDSSLSKLKNLCDQYPNTKLVALSKRFGHQMSLVAGLDHCKEADAVIMMDSDLEHPPEVIPELLAKYEEGFEVVNTKRIYNEKVSFFKKFASKQFYKFINFLSPITIEASAADFRLISVKVLKVFQHQIREQNQFLRGLIPWVGFNQCFVVFTSASRQKGVSKYNFKRLMNFAILGVISFSKVPLKISIYAGFLLSAFSILYGFYIIYDFFADPNLPVGFPTLVVFICFIGGMQLIVLGIIGEYIGSIVDEVKNRPLYIVEEKYPNE